VKLNPEGLVKDIGGHRLVFCQGVWNRLL